MRINALSGLIVVGVRAATTGMLRHALTAVRRAGMEIARRAEMEIAHRFGMGIVRRVGMTRVLLAASLSRARNASSCRLKSAFFPSRRGWLRWFVRFTIPIVPIR